MAGNSFGKLFTLTTFGESHGKAMGGIIDGCPANFEINFDALNKMMQRRKTGANSYASQRKESDEIEFLSGIFEGKTLGTPIGFVINNEDKKSSDYDALRNVFRPSHADYTYQTKYGIRDHRGGGRASARETVCRLVAGAIALQILEQIGIEIVAWVHKIGDIEIESNYMAYKRSMITQCPLSCPDQNAAEKMLLLLKKIKSEGDSIGGSIMCNIRNCPPGLGEPVFDKLQARLAHAILSINAVKAFEYGCGFNATKMRGSEHNDTFSLNKDGQVVINSNHSGGIQGGISNSKDIYFKTAFKPIASIKKIQKSLVNDKIDELSVGGRHDVCIVPRAVPIVESMAALVVLDAYLEQKAQLRFD